MPKITLQVIKNGKRVRNYYPKTKMKIWAIAKHEFDKRGQIYVVVTYSPDLYNHGTFSHITELKQFINECTEPALIKYAEEFYV